MSVKWKSRGKYDVASSEVEESLDQPVVEIDDSSLELCTVNEAVEKIGFGIFQIVALNLSGLAWSAVAMEILLLTILSPILKLEWNLTALQEATLTAVVFVGFFFGSIFWGFYADMYGRKWGLFFAAVLTSCFGILCAFSPSYEAMAFLRTMLGFAAAGSKQGITLSGEYCPAKYLRISTQLVEIYWVVGAVGIVGIGWATVPTLGWRWLLGFAAIPVIIMTFVIPFMPSSPRHLVIKGKREQALKNLNIIARFNCKPKLHVKLVTDQEKEEEVLRDEVKSEEENEKLESTTDVPSKVGSIQNGVIVLAKRPSWASKVQIFQFLNVWKEDIWKTTFLLWLVWICLEAYYYGIILLTTSLFQYDKHCSCLKDVIPDVYKTLEDEDYQVLMWTSVADAPGILLAVVLVGVPCLARRLVMVSEFGLLAMCTGLLLICVDRIYLTFVLFVCRAVIACAFQTVFLYTSEVYSQPSRSVGLALCVTVGHLGGIVAPYVAQTLLAGSDFGGILVFIFFASFAGIFAGIIPTETRNNDFKIVKCTS